MRRSCRWVILVLLLGADLLYAQSRPDPYEKARNSMVELIKKEVRETKGYLGREALSQTTIDAMQKVKRDKFVPLHNRQNAYRNRPLPIGYGQTISQPYIVALMSELLEVGAGQKVLEIGTGSGYQAAVLAEMGVEVCTIEIRPRLCEHAEKTLSELEFDLVQVRCGDGYGGWPEEAPFDGIIVTAAPDRVPDPLLEQLAVGARMVIPVGDFYQELKVITKTPDGYDERSVIPVRFVPMTGEAEEE